MGNFPAPQSNAISGDFTATGDVKARINAGSGPGMLGASGPGGEVGINVNGDIALYRSAAGRWTTLGDILIATGGALFIDAIHGYAAALISTDATFNSTNGLPFQWGSAGAAQTTVGAAGGASAPPATPTKYLKVKDSAGTTLVIPAYAAA